MRSRPWLTTAEAAETLGITAAGVRKLVQRGKLAPVLTSHMAGHVFDEREVAELGVARRSQAESERLRELAAAWVLRDPP